MASTQEVLEAARHLGDLIEGHDAALRMSKALDQLNDDKAAQHALTQLNEHVEALSLKEQNHQPIEPAEKAKLRDLQAGLAKSATLRDLQVAQMDFADLMRQVDEAISPEPVLDAGDE